MSVDTAPQRHEKTVSEIRNIATSFVGKLESAELLASGLVVAEVTTSDLVITNKAISVAELTINGKTVTAGKAAQFLVSGGLGNTEYTIRITAVTDSSPPQTVSGKVILKVEPD